MLRTLLLGLTCTLAAALAHAQAPSEKADRKQELAVQLLAQMDMDQMLTAMQQQVETMMNTQLGMVDNCEARKPALQAYSRQIAGLMSTELTSETFLPEIAQIYVDVFTEDELQGLLDFYQSALGKKMLAKMPELMQRSMAVGEQQMASLMPKIESATTELRTAIEATASECSAE